ncbi:MAG TPA: hypothetical protein VGJ55_08895 [Pyrinomonadaceae bacterium]
MFGSAVFYLGLIVTISGLVLVVKPIRRLGVPTRRRGLGVAGIGILVSGIALILPVSESRVTRIETRLDEFAPVWQFREFHTIDVAAPPARVFEAIKQVRPDEIRLLRTLVWIRRGGQPAPENIQNAAREHESMIDVATHSTFVLLADDAPRELVVGTIVGAPPGMRPPLTPEFFTKPLPEGFALATMNFVVTPNGPNHSLVSTETRVFARGSSARRRFAAYWRIIYPGSAIIRRMWLRAIQRRATIPRET